MKDRQYSLWLKLIFYFSFYLLSTIMSLKEKLQAYPYYFHNNGMLISLIPSLKQRLSFVYFELQECKIGPYKLDIVSQEIIINGIDNVMMKSKLISFLSIPMSNNTILDLEKVQDWVIKMKFSGFFSNVDYLVQSVNQHQIIHINLKVNPILKKICIFNYKHKIIPYSYILTEFRQQLGYPINFIHINQATKGITRWYHRRGYDLAMVRLVSLNQSDKSLVIDIREGTVKRIEIHIRGSQPISTSDYFMIKVFLYVKILNLKINKNFNTHDIENGLKQLNQKNIISRCTYKVTGEVEVTLLIFIEPKNHKTTYLLGQKRGLVYKVIEILKSLMDVSPTQIQQKDFFTQSTDYQSLQIPLLAFDSLFYPMTYKYNRNIFRAAFSSSIYSWFKIYKFLFHNRFMGSLNGFDLKYYFHGISFKNNFLLLNSMLSKSRYYLCFTYFTYIINSLENITNYISCEIFQESRLHTFADCTSHLHKPDFFTNCFNSRMLLQALVAFKHDSYLSMNIVLNRKLSVNKLSYKYIHLYSFSNWQNLYLSLTKQDYKVILSKANNFWNDNIEYFTKLQWQLQPNPRIRQYTCKSVQFFLRSVCIVPYRFSEVSSIYVSKYYYTNKISVGLEKTINIHRQQINIFGLGMKVLGNTIYIPSFEQNLLIGPNLIRGYSESFSLLPNQLSKISLEYLLPINLKNSVFLFFDYVCGLDCCKFINCNNHSFTLDVLEYNLKSKYRMSYGIGFYFQAPIRQIPPLRFEYGYNIDKNSCLHIRIKKNKL